MIQKIITYHCRECGSINIVRNGTNKCGSAQYHCQDCGVYRVLEPKHKYTPEERGTIMRTYRERASLRGRGRIFKVARQTVLKWLKQIVKQLPNFRETIEPAQPDDVLELDELWSFVFKKLKNGGYGWLYVVAHVKL